MGHTAICSGAEIRAGSFGRQELPKRRGDGWHATYLWFHCLMAKIVFRQSCTSSARAPSRAHAGGPGGSRARQGPRIVMRTTPRRTARRPPRGARARGCGRAGRTATGNGAVRGARGASEERRGVVAGGGLCAPRGISDTLDSLDRGAARTTRRLSARVTKLSSRTNAISKRKSSCVRVIGASTASGPRLAPRQCPRCFRAWPCRPGHSSSDNSP